MDMSSEVERLIQAVRDLEDRVRELERDDSSGIVGFEVDFGEDEFDDEETEYRQNPGSSPG